MPFPPLQLTVQTPRQIVLDAADVRWVQAQLADGGGIGIWPGHAPLLAETVAGPLRYADDSGEHELLLRAGILRIVAQQVTIYTTGSASARELERPRDLRPGKHRLAAALSGQTGRQEHGATGLATESGDE
ncbi:MAG: hypothetical protein FJ026_15895 [Chloroflexi bacterium]|nr:hypothetical protein [Chloroflexota bacterium]